MVRGSVFRLIFLLAGCLVLASCLRLEDVKGAQILMAADPRVEGNWHPVKWMDQKNPEQALVSLSKTERDGYTGYVFKSTDSEQQEDIDTLWGFDLNGVRFFVSAYPEGDCKSCEVLFYEFKDEQIYIYILKSPEAQKYMEQAHPGNKKIVSESSGEWSKDLVIKTLDQDGQNVLKDLAAHPALWENAVILKKAEK